MMDMNWIAARLSVDGPADTVLGDHDLNPGFQHPGPLRPAAVLIGLVDHPDGINVLLTRRTEHLEHHPGQISFPGGHIEDDDADAVYAALRETHEEVGIAPERVEVLGLLTPYVTRTGFRVTPVVGALTPPLAVRPDPHEVAEVFEVPLPFLMDPANHQRHQREIHGQTRHFYAMPYGAYDIWGATAGIIMDLYQTLTATPS